MCTDLFAYAFRKSLEHRALGDCVGPGFGEDKESLSRGRRSKAGWGGAAPEALLSVRTRLAGQ